MSMSTKNKRTPIDVDQWHRKNHFNFYKTFPDPNFNICFSLDITKAYQFSKAQKLSPFLVLMYLSSQACNSVEAFKRRINTQSQPYVLDVVTPSATVADSDGIFNFCNMVHCQNLKEFITLNSKHVESALQEVPLSAIENSDDQIFYSITPWLSFTSYKHAKGEGFLDIPRIVFGKFNKQEHCITMPVSIELHHAIADAIDIAKYQQSFTDHMKQLSLKM